MFFIVIHIIDQILIFVKRSTKIFSIKIQTNVLILLDKTFVLRVISPCIGQDTRKVPVPVKETSGQVPFPLLYEACDSSADMALPGLPSRRRIGREGGILHNKKRYPSKLCPPDTASRFTCSGGTFVRPRLATTGYKEWLFDCAATSLCE